MIMGALGLMFILSILFTGIVRRYILRKKILDIPNERSSHKIPIPRGGGVVIFALFSSVCLIFCYLQLIPKSLLYAIMGGGVIALVGWMDDIQSLSSRRRMAIHFIAALWAVYWLYIYPTSSFQIYHWIISAIFVLCVISSINLYNFMDGIDGFAGVEGVFVSLVAGIVLMSKGDIGIGYLCLFLAVIIGGFLVWNWPPAKIFLGDVGSGYLGYVFITLTLYTRAYALLPITFWLTIGGIFISDATFTLFYRILEGKKWYQAHREHAYQWLTHYGWEHTHIILAATGVNVILLFPIAWLGKNYEDNQYSIVTLLGCIFFIIWHKIVSRERFIERKNKFVES